MPTIHDNKEKIFTKGLNEALASSKRADFCVGYFNSQLQDVFFFPEEPFCRKFLTT
jgi:hypothetical protein